MKMKNIPKILLLIVLTHTILLIYAEENYASSNVNAKGLRAGRVLTSKTSDKTRAPKTGTTRQKSAKPSTRSKKNTQPTSKGSIQATVQATFRPTELTNTVSPELEVMLGRPTNTSITVAVLSQYSGFFTINYFSEQNFYSTSSFAMEGDVVSMVEIINLAPATNYFYNLTYQYANSQFTNQTATFPFRTQRSTSENFTFAITADIHWLDDGFELSTLLSSARNLVVSNPDFLIDIGDTFMTEKLNYNVEEMYKPYAELFQFFSTFCPSIPLYLVNGNHDGESYCGVLNCTDPEDPHRLSVLRASIRKEYYPNPLPNHFYSGNVWAQYPNVGLQADYYAWQWGNGFFVALDPFWYSDTLSAKVCKTQPEACGWAWTLGYNQYSWLKTALTNSDCKFKFVFIHNLLGGAFETTGPGADQSYQGVGSIEWTQYFEWGGNDMSGQYQFHIYRSSWTNAVPIHTIFVQTGVTCLFKGHDHLYYRDRTSDGVTYITLPHASRIASESVKDPKLELGYSNISANATINFTGGYATVFVSGSVSSISYMSYAGVILDVYNF